MRKLTTRMLMLTVLLALFSLHGTAQHAINGTLKSSVEGMSLRNGPVIYDQYYPLADGFHQSCEFTDEESLTLTNIAADDFVIPAGESWNIRYINFAGAYFQWTGTPVDGFNIYFYENDNGKPGEEIHSYEHLTSYNELSIDNEFLVHHYEAMLPEAVSLTQGHYWISIQAIVDMGNTNPWGWMNRAGETIENQYHWKNPKGGFSEDFTDWTPASELFVFGNFNLAFAFYGNGLDNDLSMISIDAPNTSETLTNSEIITISLKNEGLTTITETFQVSYSIDGADPITETVNITLSANEIAQYSFTTPADFTAAGPYTITATVTMADDPVVSNNTTSRTIYNYGTVYTMPASGSDEITTCGATFTDSGGLYGDFNQNDNGTMTIYPANAGDRIRLTFLEFDASYGGFKIYDGTDTEATLLGNWEAQNSPGVITALNPTGALTIHFQGPGWDSASGWVAYISCVTPVEDDFAMLNFTSSLATIFENNTTTLSAKIQNFGTDAQNKTVTFTADGEVIGTAETGILNTADTSVVTVEWTPTLSGTYTLVASLPEDDGAEANNTLSFEKYVYPFDAFFEDFEGGYPPEGWSGWMQGSNGFSGNHSATTMVPAGLADTLLAPRVYVKENAELVFYAVSSMWWPGEIEVYWKEEGTNDWIFLACPALHFMQYNKFTVNMSEYANQIGRFAFVAVVNDPFAWSGQVNLDYVIGQNISLHFDDLDLKLKEFTGESFALVGDNTEFTVTVRNAGLETINASDYSVKLMAGIENPTLLKSVEGQTIASNQEINFAINYAFTEVDEFILTAVVDFAQDENSVDNTSNYKVISVLPASSEINIPYESISYSNYPIDMEYNHSLSESIYLGEDIDQEGVIFGLSWEYLFNYTLIDIPVRIWVGVTEHPEFFTNDTWIPASELTEIFEGTLNFYKGEQTIYIPFSTPIHYNDSNKNIAVMVQKSTDSYSEGNRFHMSVDGVSAKMINGFSNPADPFNPEGGETAGYGPFIRFIFNDNLGSLEGSVTEIDGTAIEGASVTVDQLRITTTTNAQGNYELPYVPAGTYTATADKFGYVAANEPVQISFENTTTVDFIIGEQALVSVSGKVTGIDNPGVGIENAQVNLKGYHNYSVTTNAQGVFEFENVFSNKTYELSVIKDGFTTYIATVTVVEENMILDDIVLSEALLIPFAVVAETKGEENEDMLITWKTPTATAQQILVFDDGEFENGWAAEPGEEIWMGNLIPFTVPTTVSGFDIYWVKYTNTSTQQPMRLDIFNAAGELVVSSQEFMSQFDAWIHVEVPNMTLIGDHYAMVYWYGTPEVSTYLGWTEDNSATEYARYLYPGGQITPLSNLVTNMGTFMIRPHVMFKDDKGNGAKALTGFDIRFGKLVDLENASSWTKLNTSAINANSFEHKNWSPSDDGNYVYALQAFYTTGESEFSFSNVINYKKEVGVNTDALNTISVYPNPAYDYVTVTNSQGAKLILFGMDGSMKLQTKVMDNEYRLDVSHMASGSYLLVIQNSDSIKQFKLIVK